MLNRRRDSRLALLAWFCISHRRGPRAVCQPPNEPPPRASQSLHDLSLRRQLLHEHHGVLQSLLEPVNRGVWHYYGGSTGLEEVDRLAHHDDRLAEDDGHAEFRVHAATAGRCARSRQSRRPNGGAL